MTSHVGQNKKMRARERGVGLYKKKEHGRGDEAFRAGGWGDRSGMEEREGRCQIVGEDMELREPGPGKHDGREHEPEDGRGCERVGRSGSPGGKARSLRRGCRWRVDRTEEPKPNRPSGAGPDPDRVG
jgi:hypothetical protein